MANMNLIGVFVKKFWPVQALACGVISPKLSNFGDIIKEITLEGSGSLLADCFYLNHHYLIAQINIISWVLYSSQLALNVNAFK